jgi:hypothetical protein
VIKLGEPVVQPLDPEIVAIICAVSFKQMVWLFPTFICAIDKYE